MSDTSHSERELPTGRTRDANISTENQPKGAARHPSDTLDKERDPDPVSGGIQLTKREDPARHGQEIRP